MIHALASAAALIVCAAPRAVDGDTLRCANLPVAVRLVGIDSPELPGHCRKGRACAAGDPFAARAALSALLANGPVMVRPLGRDRYRRIIAAVSAGGRDLSCAQLKGARAIYVARWDSRRAVAHACPALVRGASR